MRGRKPKPAAIKRRTGNPGKRKIKVEPKPPAGDPTASTWLTGAALEEWNRVVPILSAMGIYSFADRAALEIYCKAYARWREAEAVIDKTGLVFQTPAGYIQTTPHVTIARRYGDQVARLAAEFGLTPSGRSRIAVESEQAGDSGSPDDFFNWDRKGVDEPKRQREAEA